MMSCALFFMIYQKRKIACITVLAPISTMLFFWIFSGQSLFNLPSYLVNSVYFIFVFTEAMAKDGNGYEIILYLIACATLLFLIYKQKDDSPPAKLFLYILVSVFLFLSFKTGFTRHNHAIIAGTSILISSLLTPFFIQPSKLRLIVVIISGSIGLFITGQYRGLSIKDNLVSTYSSSWYGLTSRIKEHHWLKRNFELIMEFQRVKASIPIMQGSTDIYSYEQTYLIASGNNWSPRPVFQSYSTFSPLLAEKNKVYLESSHRPDNIIFRVEPIDERVPSLEDGASWPLLIKNYMPIRQDNHFLYLRKANKFKVALTPLTDETHYLGEVVTVPDTNDFLFITLDLQPSWLGFFNTIFYKIGQLEIIYELENGSKVHYRLSANMAKSNFLLSPLIENIEEFAFIYNKKQQLDNKRVKHFIIHSVANTKWQWQDRYLVHFKTLY